MSARDEIEPWAIGEEVVDTYEAAEILGLSPRTIASHVHRGVLRPCGRRFRGDGGGRGRERHLFLRADIEDELDYMRRRESAS